MRLKELFISCAVSASIGLTGCASLPLNQNIHDGRAALSSGHPDDAVNYFNRAAQLDPNYTTSSALRQSVWTYLGRAYYETQKYTEARSALEKSLARDQGDNVAHLYLGLALVRSNDRERGLAEMKTGLNGIHKWLDNISTDNDAGSYWDPNKQIRKDIEKGLAGQPTAIEVAVIAQRVGKQLEEEIDRVARDETRSRYNTGSRN
jgi:Putative Zn-dependent protease, contains TPR repeats